MILSRVPIARKGDAISLRAWGEEVREVRAGDGPLLAGEKGERGEGGSEFTNVELGKKS